MPDARWHVTLALLLTAGCSTCDPDDATTGELASYRAAFVAAAGNRLQDSLAREELVRRLAATRILWLGDQHRSSRLHALQSKLLEDLHSAGIPMALALEAIGEQDEPLVREYFAGARSMEELRTVMRDRWSRSWLDDRDLDPWFYRSLLTFARRYDVPVIALEPTPRRPLVERDEIMAATVRDADAAYQGRLLVVVVGQA
ncbi:MAG: ChaN family lipoprotein, partial [Planctomycetota bacterium]